MWLADTSALTTAVKSADIASLDSILGWWEWIEYIAEGFVILGCIAEFIAEFSQVRTSEFRHSLNRAGLLILTCALAIELGALARTNRLSGQEIALLNKATAEALAQTAQLGKDSAKFEDEAEQERLARVKIEQRVAWRHFLAAQKSEIGSRLKMFAGQRASLWYNASDVEGSLFASDIAMALQAAEWKVSPPGGC